MNIMEPNQRKEIQREGSYQIRRNYGNESMETCMLQVIRMIVAQNLRKE